MVLPTSGSISISDINSCARFTNGNMGINTTSPNYNLDINGTLKATTITAGDILATTSVSSGAVNATNSTVTNAVSTNISAGTLNLSTGLTSANALFTNITSSNISIPGFINTQIDTTTTTIQPDLIGTIKDGGIHYWSQNIISDTTYVNWGPVYNESNLTRVKGISNVSGTSLSVQIRITGTAQNSTDISNITGTFYVANSSGNLVSTIYEYTVATATPGPPPFYMATPGVLAIDTGYITVTIPQGGSIQSKDNFANDSNYLTIQSPYVYINVLTSKTNIPTLLNTNIVSTNVSAGTLNLSTGLTAGTILATTSVSSGAVYATNSTVTNLYSTNSTLANLRSTLSSIGTLRTDLGVMTEGLMVKASINTSLTAANLLATTSVSSGAVYATNSTVTNLVATSITAGPIFATNNVNASQSIVVQNTNSGSSAYSALTLVTDQGNFNIFKNSTTRTVDGGVNTVTMRNDGGPLRLQSNTGLGIWVGSTGNVGINTTSPGSLLSLISPDPSVDFQLLDFRNTSNYGIYAQTDSINARGNNLRFLARDYNTNNITTRDILTMRPEGNVGIGTATPGSPLHVAGNGIGTNGALFITGADSFGNSLHIASSSASHKRLGFNHNGTIGNIFAFDYVNGPQNLILQYPGGNVGIGTTSPSSKLNVSGDTDIFGALRVGSSSSSTSFLINLGTAGVGSYRSGIFYGESNNIYLSNQQNGSISFGTNNTLNRFTIYADGRCGIGTSSTPANNGLQINSGELQFRGNNSSAFHIYGNNGTLEFYSGSWGAGTYVGGWYNNGLTVVGALSKGSGTFDIQHPLHQDDKTKRLVHSFIEGPRCDLIYRGKVQLVNGTATINIDSDCVEETGSEMTQGTFEALCANPQFFLQNPSSFSRLKGSISGNVLTVVCEDQNSSDIIYWSVIAERKDAFIKQWNRTNANGYLITEYEGINNIPSLG